MCHISDLGTYFVAIFLVAIVCVFVATILFGTSYCGTIFVAIVFVAIMFWASSAVLVAIPGSYREMLLKLQWMSQTCSPQRRLPQQMPRLVVAKLIATKVVVTKMSFVMPGS